MGKFNGYVLTEKGRAVLAKGLAGGKIEFTKMQIGDGESTISAREMTALVSPKQDLQLLSINVKGGQCELSALLSNQGLTTGFYVKELGVFAKGDDDVEILYAYNVSVNPDFIPPFNSNNIVEIEYVDTLIVDRVANITATIDPSITYITKKYADENYLEAINLARILGVGDTEYGGLITETGIKTQGKAYFDIATKSMYLCRNTNSQNFVDSVNFTAFSNAKILDRVENLYDFKKENLTLISRNKQASQGITIYKIGNIRIINLLNVSIADNVSNDSFVLPSWFKAENNDDVFSTTVSDFTGITAEVYYRNESNILEFNDSKYNAVKNRAFSGQIVII